MNTHEKASGNRRDFLKKSVALTAVAPLLRPGHLFGSDRLRVGLVGCGGRGTGAAMQALRADPGVELVAMADIFADHLKLSLASLQKVLPKKVKVDPEHRFLGFDAYQKLIDSGVDVVILATPPAFRPEQFSYAVKQDKHIFCEKPMGVDVTGARRMLSAVEEARKKKLAINSGFCWRYSVRERETFQRILDGALGQVHTVYTTYNTSPLRIHPRQPGWSDVEFQLRNWQHFTWLGGDHIVEQDVHSIDKMAWALGGEMPVRAWAVGGRQARGSAPERGNVYDHFSVTYEFKSGARGFNMCRQIAHCANDNSDLIMGTEGICRINGWAPRHVITGRHPWRCRTPRNNMYQQEHNEFFAAIRSGKPHNDGDWMVKSTLLAIMGRLAAYTGQAVTWDQLMNSKEDLLPKQLAWGPMPMPPVAIPGKTRLV